MRLMASSLAKGYSNSLRRVARLGGEVRLLTAFPPGEKQPGGRNHRERVSEQMPDLAVGSQDLGRIVDGLGSRQNTSFAELVNSVENELNHEDGEENRQDVEQPFQIDAPPQTRPGESNRDRAGQTKRQAERNSCRSHLEESGRDHQRSLHSLARDHQKRKAEDSPESPRGRGEVRLCFDVRFDV